ncbi:MAG TPA: LCP family protein [Solirubrobacterales bacterium]|nr:LCP family protein [Solirubrobacterales bacterium]
MSADDRDEGREGGTDPLDEREEKGLGLTEEFARLEEEIRREVGGGEESESPAAEDPSRGDAAEGPAAGTPTTGGDSPPAGEWTAPEEPAPGPDTEEWAAAGATEDGVEAEADEPGAGAADAGVEADEEPAAGQEPEEAAEPPSEQVEEHTFIRHGPPPTPIAATAYAESEADPEVKTPALWWRFMTASVLIVVTVATAVSVSSLLLLTDVAAKLQPIPGLEDKIAQIDPGDPQTILIVGSDERTNIEGDPGRSDTTMLLRVDPDDQVLSLFSLPRDLKVDIPGYGVGKLNEAYADGGVEKTLETVQNLTGLEINHVVNVDFNGFAKAVDAIGCVYVDVDRHYFNDNSTALSSFDTFAEINVNAGYQRLCGQNALDYVRYRHTDTDIVRAARQQDFLRNARAQVPISEVLPIIGGDTGSDLIDIFTNYPASDIDSAAQMIGALKAFLSVKDVPINQISFDGTLETSYVTATPEQIEKAVDEFLNGKDTPGPTGGEDATKKRGSGSKDEKEKKEEDPADDANVIPTSEVLDPETGINKFEAFGRTSARRLDFPVWVPTVVAPGSLYSEDSRQYEIKDQDDKKQPAYKLVIEYTAPDRLPEYYGVQGTTWSDPPILKDASETREIDGRDYDIYYDGDRVRLVAWHDEDDNSYWVSNTLLQTLDESQMLAIAASMKEIK